MSTERQQQDFSPTGFMRTYRQSEVIFEQGTIGSEMYLIRRGKVALTVKQGQDKRVTLVNLGPGDFFGEMALVDDSPRSACALAAEEGTELIILDRPKFLFLVRQQPEFALSLMHTLCQRIRAMDSQLSNKGNSHE